MANDLNKVYIYGGKRTPFAKSFSLYKNTSLQELMSLSLKELVMSHNLLAQKVDDVALGGVMVGPTNWNIARECVLESGLSPYTPAYNVQRACGTGLETTNHLFMKIAMGQAQVGISGGMDTNSDLPILISKSLNRKLMGLNNARTMGQRLAILASLRPSDLKPQFPAMGEPRTGLSMGDHCELMVKEWGISRAEQDELAYLSHRNAGIAYKEGFYSDMVITYKEQSRDLILREDTTVEKLAKLRPAFDKKTGTLTAGNSTPLTDGSSAVLLGSEKWGQQTNREPWARIVDVEASAVDFVKGDGLLMAPTVAVGELLKRNNMNLQDFHHYEIHEAFAGQALCTLKAWNDASYCKKFLKTSGALGIIERSKMNVKGGSLALGHPFGATGGRCVMSLAKQLKGTKGQRGLISICTAGGMGVAAILESV